MKNNTTLIKIDTPILLTLITLADILFNRYYPGLVTVVLWIGYGLYKALTFDDE